MDVGDVVEAVGDAVELLPESEFEPLILPLGEYLVHVLGLFADTLDAIMDMPLLRFFAAFGVVWVVLSLCSYLVKSGKALSR